MKLNLPIPVSDILQRLVEKGYEAAVVGGCVRDSLLGIVPKDWDIATSAHPEETILALQGIRVLTTGLKHGTVTALHRDMAIEITTYRIDGEYTDNRHPDTVHFTSSLPEDLARRDFTVNALAYSEQEGLIDCFGGQSDLQAGVLRCVGSPTLRFQEDALRILRGLRFCAVLGLTPEPGTAHALREQKALLDHIARERISTELTKLLCGKHAAHVLREFPDVVGQVLPEILPMLGFNQKNPHHIYDVWEHTLHALDSIEPDPVLRWAILLHDSGKPYTFSLDSKGTGHFYGHQAVSVRLSEEALKRLRLDNRTIRRVSTLIRLHDIPLQLDPAWVRRRLNRMGKEDFIALLSVKRADSMAQNPAYRDRIDALDAMYPLLEQVLEDEACFRRKDLKIDGSDLLQCGIPAGPQVGRILQALLEAVMDGTLENTPAVLKAAAEELYHARSN